MSDNLQPISYDDLKSMTDYYKATMTPGDSLSAWVGKADLDRLFADNPTANGLRLYFARHDKETMGRVGWEYKDKLTVVFVTTLDETGGSPTTENSVDLLSPADPAVTPTNFTGEGGDLVPLCPPRCPTVGGSL